MLSRINLSCTSNARTKPNQVSFGNKIDKLYQKFDEGRNCTGEEALTLLGHYGLLPQSQKGSHINIPVPEQSRPLTISPHNPKQQLKNYQVQAVANAVRSVR